MIHTHAHPPRRGIVLIAVLIVVVLLSLAAWHYSTLISAEYAAMSTFTKTLQTRAICESGAHYTAALLADPFALAGQLGNNPYDNAASFQDMEVFTDPVTNRKAMFSIVALPRPEELASGGMPFRFGVGDENSKLNLNSLLLFDPTGQVGFNMLLQLPNMTPDLANSILDWLDPRTSTPREGGAKDDEYQGRSPPYRCKNGPLDSLEEMLLIKGVTPFLLYGNDRNRNGVLDPDEDAGSGGVDLGWQAYLTVHSTERNVSSYGTARDNLNNKDLLALSGFLNEAFPDNPEIPTFILALRMYGGYTLPSSAVTSDDPVAKAAAELLQRSMATPDDVTTIQGVISLRILGGRPGNYTIPTLWDVVGGAVRVNVPSGGRNSSQKIMVSPFLDVEKSQTLLPILFDLFTTQATTDLIPRINVATAPRVVLNALAMATADPNKPVLTTEQIDAIVAAQPQFTGPVTPDIMYTSLAGLLADGTIDLLTLKTLDALITTKSEVYRFQVVAYYDGPGPMARAEAVVDTNSGRPRIVYWRELTELGPGFPLGPNGQ